ncbi:hypothetical protein B0H16DRAFT_1733921 [Mycena metata]|uniref:Restriction of telomere capping protein 4 C-terminal domain-containing protein n=1 Tax=Mycena metata TaxID=1033252 RepID=A0AAD7HYG3_9AGAR|nr:hypothetical protein B0H16DRAFT_1733921 [Mycena metata]
MEQKWFGLLAPSTPINAKKSKENIAPKPPLPANRPQPKPLYKKKLTEVPASPSPKKRKAPDSASEPAPQPAKKSKIILSPIPVSCPAEGCKDLVPNPVPRSIVQLFRQRQELIDADGATAAACNELTAEICKAIRAEDERSRCLAEAKTIGWPLNINFDTLAPRIMVLSHEINRLSSSSISLNKSPVWRAFLKRIDYKVWAFSRASSRFPSAQLGCGYYGPKGLEIIKHALKDIQKEEDEDDDSIENCLFATLSGLIDTPNNWDEYDDDSNLISPNKFMKFILIPHVVASLIAEDLEIELREAVDILELSEQYGFLFNADPPPKVDLVVSPVYAQQAPPRLRKKLTLLPPKQKTITLEDFPPPPPPKSKSKKAQIVGKPKAASPIKKPPSKPKPVQKPLSKSGTVPAKAPKSSSKLPTEAVSQPKPALRRTTRRTGRDLERFLASLDQEWAIRVSTNKDAGPHIHVIYQQDDHRRTQHLGLAPAHPITLLIPFSPSAHALLTYILHTDMVFHWTVAPPHQALGLLLRCVFAPSSTYSMFTTVLATDIGTSANRLHIPRRDIYLPPPTEHITMPPALPSEVLFSHSALPRAMPRLYRLSAE